MPKFKYCVTARDKGAEVEATGYRTSGGWLVFYQATQNSGVRQLDSLHDIEVLRLRETKLFKVERVEEPDTAEGN